MSSEMTLGAVAELIRETLLLPADHEIESNQLLFYDLAFTSMDMLDLLFRVEQRFDVVIPEGTLYEMARGGMDETEFAREGVLTEAGRKRLMALLHETPREVFPTRVHATALQRYCAVGAIVRLVEHKLAERNGDVRADAGDSN